MEIMLAAAAAATRIQQGKKICYSKPKNFTYLLYYQINLHKKENKELRKA